MSSLTFPEKKILEDLLKMGSGYVLDFTDRDFSTFFKDFNIDIDIDKYHVPFGSSKAKRLRSFWEKEKLTFNSSAIEEVIHIVTKPGHPSLIRNNRAFHRHLTNGVKIEYHDGDEKKTEYVQLIDFNNPDNNQYLVINQFTVQGTKMNRRPDLVVFINGLPLAVIELKNPADEGTDVWDAYNQITTYKLEHTPT